MTGQLAIAVGQCTDKGRKETNQDFHGVTIPPEPLLSSKGICVALADGISSSGVSQVASESAVKAFLEDYYCTSEAWSVRTSGERVLSATNSWLYSQTRRSQFRYDQDKGYVCTFSGMVLKSSTAHVLQTARALASRTLRVSGRSPAGAKNRSFWPRQAAVPVQVSGPVKMRLETDSATDTRKPP